MPDYRETEARVLRNPTSLRSIKTIADSFGLSQSAFVDRIRGKTILDIGSGFNGLAIDVALRNIDCTVYSVDPNITNQDYERRQRLSLSMDRNAQFTEFEAGKIEAARVASLERAYPYFAHNMPEFRDGQFDLLIDHYAVFGYFQDEIELQAFLVTLAEERRVLAAGAPLYIADFDVYKQDPPNPSNWKERELIRMGLRYELSNTAFSIIAYN